MSVTKARQAPSCNVVISIYGPHQITIRKAIKPPVHWMVFHLKLSDVRPSFASALGIVGNEFAGSQERQLIALGFLTEARTFVNMVGGLPGHSKLACSVN